MVTIPELLERIREDLAAGRPVWLSLSEEHATATVQLSVEDRSADSSVFRSADGFSELEIGSEVSIESVYRRAASEPFPAWLAVTLTDAETEQELVDVLLELRPGDERYAELS